MNSWVPCMLEVFLPKDHRKAYPTPTPATKSSSSNTGVTDPKDVQKMMNEAQIEIDHSHRQNTVAIDPLMAPLQCYANQGDLVEQLARKTEECANLQKALRHQREENQRLQVSLNLYREKEAVAAESRTPVAPPPGISMPTLTTRQQELMLAQANLNTPSTPDVNKSSSVDFH